MESSEIESRHKAEKLYHDKKFGSAKKKDYYSIGFTQNIFEAMMKKIDNIEGKNVIDFGCGEGWLSEILIKKGAKVWSFDISEEAVRKVRAKTLQKFNSDNKVYLIQSAAEALGFRSNSFDYVIGSAILHHTDLKTTAQEIHRILKKGGKAYFAEPLGHNPIINWYRERTPDLRSPDEKPLLFNDYIFFKKFFKKFSHEEYYLIVLLSLFWYFIFRNDRLMLMARNALIKLDNIILRFFPFLRKYCWYTILQMEK